MSAILKRKVLYVRVQFVSPISVSSGEDEFTDSDLLRNFDEEIFIPGTSLAGAMRSYLEKEGNEKSLMGYSDNDDVGKMSSLFISDLTFDEGVSLNVRDGVALDENKVAKTNSKFDMEILEARAKAHFYLELTIRKDDDEKEMESALSKVFHGINNGEIRLGSKKTRGFGQFKILSISTKTYDKDNYLKYANAYDDETWKDLVNELPTWLEKAKYQPNAIHIEVPLRLEGGISIRRYAAKKGEPDYEHITDHGVPVIPGSSFAGAIRHRINTIFEDKKLLEKMFGSADKENAHSSRIIINETEIKDAKPLVMTRTGISRFESSAKTGSLYKEKTYVDGNLVLKISVKGEEKNLVGILLLAIKDLQNGFLAVGGQTAIGRGVFSANGPILINGQAGKEEEYIKDALTNLKMNGGKE